MPDSAMFFRRCIYRAFMWYLKRVMATRCPTCNVEYGYCQSGMEPVHATRVMVVATQLVDAGKQL